MHRDQGLHRDWVVRRHRREYRESDREEAL
jgi:hypothetical protein